MGDVHFLFAHPLVLGVEGNNARVRDPAVAGAEENV